MNSTVILKDIATARTTELRGAARRRTRIRARRR
jgi:hypothetical protein